MAGKTNGVTLLLKQGNGVIVLKMNVNGKHCCTTRHGCCEMIDGLAVQKNSFHVKWIFTYRL